jgi:NDP-sugar pyrophosphorylase family protein
MISLKNYKAVILAGGKGTRLYPITKEIPKPLLPINKKPIINHLVDLFRQHGIKEIAVLINKDFKQDFEWWKKRYYPELNISLVKEEQELGTFGGLYLLKDWIKNSNFFLTNGDELKKIDLLKMADFHNKIKTLATIAVIPVKDPQNYGVVVCNSDKVKEFVEKPENPSSNYINSGLYLLNSEIINHHPGPEFSMIEKDIFPQLAQEEKLGAFKFNGQWTDCGTWERYEKALTDWKP